MSWRAKFWLVGILVVVFCGGGLPERQALADRPNVLFLICDDLNCDLGCYGHPLVQSPHIDRLAEQGVRFENAHCQYPLCGPSRASFMSGLYPDQTLIHRNSIYLRERVPNVETLSQMFRNEGYFATRIGKIYHYQVPMHIGTSGHDDPDSWDQVINPRGRDKDDEPLIFSLQPGKFGGTLSWLAADGTDAEQTDGIAARHAARLLAKHADEGTPFFMAVGLYRPHTPYVAPKAYFEKYPIDQIKVPSVPEGYLETLPQPARASLLRKKDQVNLKPELARQAIQAYYASISFADAQVGLILDALEQNGLRDNTIVVFTSDHGYHMGEHGYYQKTTLFENATHVPLIISVPGWESAGRSTAALAEMVDFHPTLAELCGFAKRSRVAGVSQVPVLKNPAGQVRDSAFTQYGTGYSLRTLEYRYTEWGPEGSDGVELYDVAADPEELHNLAHAPDSRPIRERLSKQLRRRIAAANRVPEGVWQVKFDNRRIVK